MYLSDFGDYKILQVTRLFLSNKSNHIYQKIINFLMIYSKRNEISEFCIDNVYCNQLRSCCKKNNFEENSSVYKYRIRLG